VRVDIEGNIYVTYSGQRGQQLLSHCTKITANYTVKTIRHRDDDPTGWLLDREGYLYVSCGNRWTIHR